MIPRIIRVILFMVFNVSYYSFRVFVWLMRAAFGDRNCLLAVAELAQSPSIEHAAAHAGVAGGLQHMRELLSVMLQGAPAAGAIAPDEAPKGDF